MASGWWFGDLVGTGTIYVNKSKKFDAEVQVLFISRSLV